MRPVGRPRLAENGCSNSEGGVRPGLCYHTIGGQPHTKSHIGISTAKASVCRANRRAKALPHHPAHTIKPSVSKGSTGGNVATWGARTASVVWKDISDARGGEAGFLGMATRATGEQSHCQYTMANQQRIQPPSRPRNQCLSAICCESTRQNMPKGGTPGRQSAPCKSGTNCRGGALPGISPLGQGGVGSIRFVRLGRICTHDVKIYISWILRSRWIKNMTISTTPPVLAYAVAVTNVSSPERRPTIPVIGLCNQTSTGEPVTTDGGPLRSMMCRPDGMRLFVLSCFLGSSSIGWMLLNPFP